MLQSKCVLLMTKQKCRWSLKTTAATNAGILHLVCLMYKIISSSLYIMRTQSRTSVWGNGGSLFSKTQMHVTLALLQRLPCSFPQIEGLFTFHTHHHTLMTEGQWAEHSRILQPTEPAGGGFAWNRHAGSHAYVCCKCKCVIITVNLLHHVCFHQGT